MKELSTSSHFRIRDEKAFNVRVKENFKKWADFKERYNSDLSPVEMAIGEALQDPKLAEIVIILNPERYDVDRTLASWRSENKAPEMFRAMFSEEVAAC